MLRRKNKYEYGDWRIWEGFEILDWVSSEGFNEKVSFKWDLKEESEYILYIYIFINMYVYREGIF